MPRETNPIICYVTDSASLPGGATRLPDAIVRAVERGANWVQIREKNLPTRDLLALTQQAIQRARPASVKIIVNDRLDVALAAGADGVHLGGNSLPVAAVAKWRARSGIAEFLIGASCHSMEEGVAAERDGADYIFFGPVFGTPKMPYGAPQGLERLAQVAGACQIPVLAIGGVSGDNSVKCLQRGAGGYAAIRLFQEGYKK